MQLQILALLLGVSATDKATWSQHKKIGLRDVELTMKKWAEAAEARDVDATISLYDPEIGRLLGTVDEANSPRRTDIHLFRDYFNNFLGGNEAVVPKFPQFDPADVIFLSDDTASYSGYYVFGLTKGGVTKDVYAKFTYILRTTPNGVRIVTHNSGITPIGAIERERRLDQSSAFPEDGFPSASELQESDTKITKYDIQRVMSAWAEAVENRNVDNTVALYDPEMGRLLGTVDDENSPRRTSIPLIREYFEGFLRGNSMVQPNFPAFDERDVIYLSEDTAAYSGYYMFALTKGGVTKDVYAKFTYILRKTLSGTKIVTHNSLITPTGVVERKGLRRFFFWRSDWFKNYGMVSNPMLPFAEDPLPNDSPSAPQAIVV